VLVHVTVDQRGHRGVDIRRLQPDAARRRRPRVQRRLGHRGDVPAGQPGDPEPDQPGQQGRRSARLRRAGGPRSGRDRAARVDVLRRRHGQPRGLTGDQDADNTHEMPTCWAGRSASATGPDSRRSWTNTRKRKGRGDRHRVLRNPGRPRHREGGRASPPVGGGSAGSVVARRLVDARSSSDIVFDGRSAGRRWPQRFRRVDQAGASAASIARGESTSASAIAAQPAIPAPCPSALCSIRSSRVTGTMARR
jgi:hypothetical protein